MSVQTRRNFIGAAAASAGPFFLFGKGRQTNLLFIMSDQHQRSASGCYGSREVKTPNVDAIAANAVRFNRAYCQAPVCVPARGSIVTGLYPHTHGAKTLQDPLPEKARTIGHFFKERGYATGAIGKMHFVDETKTHGFDYRLHHEHFLKTLTKDEQARIRKDQGGAEAVTGRPSDLPSGLFQDHYYAEETVKFLHENRNRPFCLWSSFLMPHTPLVPMRRYFEMYSSARMTLPRRTDHELQEGFVGHLIRSKERGWYTQTDEELHTSLAGYYGNVSQMDGYVGRVYDTLRELGLDKNTVVVYTADHGEMAGAHRMWTKHNMFEQSVGVPLLVSLPDRMGAGTVREHLIEHVDLFPTLAELCGLGPVKGLHGRSFAALLQNRKYEAREFAYSEYYFCHNVFTRDDRYVGKPPILMVRTGKWKLNYLDWEKCELYDLTRDPGESHNCIDDPGNAGIVKELKNIANRMYRL